MTTYGIVFPGQGSQLVGMGKDLYEHDDSCKALFNKANEVLGRDLTSILFDGPKDILTQTQNAQPGIFLVSACIWEQLKTKGISPKVLAGHSLGELTAYYASGALSFESALQLIKVRGEAMAAAYPSEKSGMAAIMGMDQEKLSTLTEPFRNEPVVLANINCPGQIVISGEKSALEKVYPILKENGAKVIPLPVSGAFHSPLMQSASETLKEFMATIDIQDATTPIILNRTATAETKAEALRNNISEQVISSVRWVESMHTMTSSVDAVIECGPGKVLTGLMRKISSDTPMKTLNTLEALVAV